MILADTGLFVALANRRDRWHERAVQALEALDEPLVTTWPVLTETCHLLASRLSADAAIRFMDGVARGAVLVVDLDPEELEQAAPLMARYRSLPMDLADASLVLLAERWGDGRILSTDERDFGTYRFKRHHPFDNLLPPG